MEREMYSACLLMHQIGKSSEIYRFKPEAWKVILKDIQEFIITGNQA